MPSRPLDTRLANPPATLVGRAEAIDRLVAAIERAAVTAILGPGGIGKTALVSAVLFERYPAQAKAARVAHAQRGDSVPALLAAALHALSGSRASAATEWTTESTEGLTELLIEQLESEGAWLIIEDVHHIEPQPAFDIWLDRLARYLRSSRVIVTGRRTLALPSIVEQLVPLAPLDDHAAMSLLQSLNPLLDADQTDRLVARAGGLPLAIRRLAVASLSPTPADELVQRFMVRAALVDAPLPRPDLALLIDEGEAALDALEVAGVLDITGDGVRVHDIVREDALASLTTAKRKELVEEVARTLADRSPVAVLEAVRLLAEADDATAQEVATAHIDRLFADRLGPRLFLMAKAHPRLRSVAWQCVLRLGGGEALVWAVEQPAPDDPAEALQWLLALNLAGRHAACREHAARIRSQHPTIAPAAVQLQARAALQMGAADEVLQLLSSTQPANEHDVSHRAVLALAHAASGDPDGALVHSRWLAAQASTQARWAAATIYAALGRGRLVDEILRGWDAETLSEEMLRSRAHRLTYVLRACERVELDEAEPALARLQRFPPQASDIWHRHMQHVAGIRLAMARGQFDGIDRRIATIQAEAISEGEFWSAEWCSMLDAVVRLAKHESIEPPPLRGAPHSPARMVLEGCRWVALARAGNAPPPVEDLPDFIEARVLARRAHGAFALVEGRADLAIEHLEAARAQTLEHDLRVQELAVVRELAEAYFVAGKSTRAAELADWLKAFSQSAGAHRYTTAADGILLLLAPSCDEALRLAQLEHGCPSVIRRARSLLGVDVDLDRVERCILAAASSGVYRGSCGDGPWDRTWGIDLREARWWSAEAQTKPLTALAGRLLRRLAGGPATKEELLVACWDQRTYHPIRDDKRLQMAIRRLRDQVEPDPAAPVRVLTTSDGYRLGDAPFAWVEHASADVTERG